MTGLKNPCVCLIGPDGTDYGGSQRLLSSAVLRRCGCGIVAAADLLIYLSLYHGLSTPLTDDIFVPEMSVRRYNDLCSRLSRSWLPVIPGLGKTGPALSLGLNSLFRKYQLPLRAVWCSSRAKLFSRIEGMLRADLPVILSIGQNFPIVWEKNHVSMRSLSPSGSISSETPVKAHYVVVTGIDDEKLRVSSWGRMYYIDRRDFMDYSRRHSLPTTCNILLLLPHSI